MAAWSYSQLPRELEVDDSSNVTLLPERVRVGKPPPNSGIWKNPPVWVILIAVSLIAFAACGVLDSGASNTSLADGPRWVLESMDGNPPIEGTFPWLKLNGDHSSGVDGCNTFGGRSEDGKSVARADGTFLSPPYLTTLESCGDLVNDQSNAYLDTLAEGRRFRVSDGRLEILDESGVVRLSFVKQSPLPGQPADLMGTAWRLILKGDDDARPATLVFLSDHWAAGVTACRGYIAGYQTSEKRARFPTTSMTETGSPCLDDKALWRKEAEFTDDLSRTNEYSVHDEEGASRLYLRTSRGRTLIFEPLIPVIDHIADREWQLRSLAEDRELGPGISFPYTDDIPTDSEVTISFKETIVSGLAECHSFEAPLSVEGSRITIGSVTTAERECGDSEGSSDRAWQYLMEQTQRYLDLLPRVKIYQIFGDRLFIHADGDAGLLFEAK